MRQLPGVLVVDDDASNRESILMVLDELPYPMQEASDSAQTLDLLRASPRNLVVVFDMLLPNLENGLRVLHALRDETALHRHAVVAITASPRRLTPATMTLLSRLSAPLILKPFDVDALLTAVEQAAERSIA